MYEYLSLFYFVQLNLPFSSCCTFIRDTRANVCSVVLGLQTISRLTYNRLFIKTTLIFIIHTTVNTWTRGAVQ